MRFSKLINFFLFLSATIIGIVLCELICRKVYPNDKYEIKYALFVPNLRRVFKPKLDIMPGVFGEAKFFTNSFGIRGDEFSNKQKYRILAIGGSTTESLYIDQEKSWPYILQKKLNREFAIKNIWVGNAGKSGLNSRDYIVEEKILLEELPKIDLVIVLSGVNDMTVRLSEDKNFSSVKVDENNLTKEQISRVFSVNPFTNANVERGFVPKNTMEKCFWCLFKVNYSYTLSKRREIQDEAGSIYKNWRENRKNASKIIDIIPDVKLSLEEYSFNLNKIIDIAENKGVKIFFATQPSLWKEKMTDEENNLLWLGGIGDFQNLNNQPYYSTRVLEILMNEYNKITLEVCKNREINCLDLARLLPKDITYFYDDAHYNDRGSEEVAKIVFDFLVKNVL